MKICKFCGSENENSASKCSSCGGNEFKNKCENCGTIFENGNYCPKCGMKVGTALKKCPNCGTEYYSLACPNCGHIDNENKTNEVIDLNVKISKEPVHKRKTWLWVLGWICIFPVPLTILINRNERLNKVAKSIIIVLAWVLYLIIAITGGDSSKDVNKNSETQSNNQVVQSEENEIDESVTQESAIENIVNEYNVSALNKMKFSENFNVQDKSSGHYRTEFRLAAYNEAVGKSYKIDECIVDIISAQDYSDNIDIRIYADDATLEQCAELIQYASPLLDPTMPANTIEETLDYIVENKKANGYYYGKLELLLLENESNGYDLMIKSK